MVLAGVILGVVFVLALAYLVRKEILASTPKKSQLETSRQELQITEEIQEAVLRLLSDITSDREVDIVRAALQLDEYVEQPGDRNLILPMADRSVKPKNTPSEYLPTDLRYEIKVLPYLDDKYGMPAMIRAARYDPRWIDPAAHAKRVETGTSGVAEVPARLSGGEFIYNPSRASAAYGDQGLIRTLLGQ